MINTDKLIIEGDPSHGFAYLYHKIIGDGHCFANCYLDTCCKTYQKEPSKEGKAFIARKMRLDFANYLMSNSEKDPKDICARLNILNSSTMARFFKMADSEESTIPLFEEIQTLYKNTEGITFEDVYAMITSLELFSSETDELATHEYIKSLYERDPRYNNAVEDSRSYKYGFTKKNLMIPDIISKFFLTEDHQDPILIFETVKSLFEEDKNMDVDLLYKYIFTSNLIDSKTMEPVTYKYVKQIYERDPKYNMDFDEYHESHDFIDLVTSGIDKLPITIKFYEITNSVPTNIDQIIESIRILCSSTAFLTHEESQKIATFLRINSIVFPMGSNYDTFFRLIDEIKDVPEILLVNLDNIHWNMIMFQDTRTKQKLLMGVPEETKKQLFDNLKYYYSKRKL